MKLRVRNVVRPGSTQRLVVEVTNDRISELGEGTKASAEREIDGHGGWLVPRFIDVHGTLSHASECDDAVRAGFGSVVGDARTTAPAHPAMEFLPSSPLFQSGEGNALSPKLPEGALWRGRGVAPASLQIVRRALELAFALRSTVEFHAEDRSLTGAGVLGEGAVAFRLGLAGVPAPAETTFVASILALMERAPARVHLSHLTCRGSFQRVAAARAAGLPVTCDVTAHHLALTDAAAEGYAVGARVWPPLRPKADVDAARAAVEAGVVDAISTDHLSVAPSELERPFAEAAVHVDGYREFWPRLGASGVSRARLLECLVQGPARVLGLAAPVLEIGAPASFVVLGDSGPLAVVARGTLWEMNR